VRVIRAGRAKDSCAAGVVRTGCEHRSTIATRVGARWIAKRSEHTKAKSTFLGRFRSGTSAHRRTVSAPAVRAPFIRNAPLEQEFANSLLWSQRAAVCVASPRTGDAPGARRDGSVLAVTLSVSGETLPKVAIPSGRIAAA